MSFKLKLNVNTLGLGGTNASSPGTPSATTPGGSKLKLKLGKKSQPPTPAPVTTVDESSKPKKTKAGRTAKPSAKVVESRKRIKEESDSEDEGSTIAVQPPTKKLKIKMTSGGGSNNAADRKTPVAHTPISIKPKLKGKPPKRPLGEGYDSEASDKEEDPMIEEEFVLRMLPGDDCDYLRQNIVDKKMGIPPSLGGPNINMKFYHADGRRASINIRGKIYAATLVDLPCIIEGMKSWDKRGWWKSADICQMLWVFAPIQKEEEAKTIPLPKIIDPVTHQYPHGLTPPLHFARKRRFKARISRNTIEATEEAVEKLLEADAAAQSSRWEMVDPELESRRASHAYSPGPGSSPGAYNGDNLYSEDEDAEGEADDTGYFNTNHNQGMIDDGDDMDADLMADLEAAMEADQQIEAETPMSTVEATQFMNTSETPAPAPEDDSGDESMEGDEDDDDDDDEAEVDDDERARIAEKQGLREDIADLTKQIEGVQAQLAAQSNPILKKRLETSLKNFKAELQIKKSSLNEDDED
ncbi:TAFII55 protein conserved region-domain-containing protein [Tricladium varicosporioides]|nr:TAFII55 protein conserved region-domain-containing protein [Hymenoscyphus varicosporioides]